MTHRGEAYVQNSGRCSAFTDNIAIVTDVCREAVLDAKYLQADELPPQHRPSVSATAGGGGGSSLMGAVNTTRHNKDFIQAASISHPVPQPPQFSRPPQLSADTPPLRAGTQVPLASSYFPNKS